MNGPRSENVSDDSEEEVEKDNEDVYRRKYQLLLERCEILQQDNERLVHRAQQVKKLMRRSRKERKVLMGRLDYYNDNWRNVPISFERDGLYTFPNPVKRERGQTVIPAVKGSAGAFAGKNTATSERGRKSAGPTGNSTSTTKRKSAKGEKPEKDPNAPKRPANPFLQFCQEQRPLALSAAGLDRPGGAPEGETTKQEITKQLASKWNTLPRENKKIYYEMYEKSKEKYAEEMKLYSANNQAKPSVEESAS